MQTYFIELSYLLASIFFILGLKGMSHPETAKRGMHLAEFGMLMAIVGTLMHHEIVTYTWILAGLAVGSVVGLAMGVWVPMTAMPQRTALSHAFGAFAAALVGISEFYREGGHLPTITMSALGFEVMRGALTTTGSLLAFAKLQGLVRGTPMTYKGQNIFNMALLAVTIGIFVYLVIFPGSMPLFFTMVGLAFIFGLLLVFVFLLTGQYMEYVHNRTLTDGVRVLYRSRHIYLLLNALINITLGLYVQYAVTGWRRSLQLIGRY